MANRIVETKVANCKVHGDTVHVLDVKFFFRCRPCRVDAVQRRRIKVKQKAVDYLGGCCKKCGYNRYIGSLEFHHRDQQEKDFSISKSLSWKTIVRELDKCDLLCANCHREEHEIMRKNLLKKVGLVDL